jgi:hypothetical protein
VSVVQVGVLVRDWQVLGFCEAFWREDRFIGSFFGGFVVVIVLP